MKVKQSDADYISVYLFERKADIDNGQGYTLGKLDWRSEAGWISIENDASIQNKSTYKYEYFIKQRNEAERPSKLQLKIYDRYYSIVAKNPGMQEEKIDSIVKKEFKLTDKKLEENLIKVSVFNMSEDKNIIE